MPPPSDSNLKLPARFGRYVLDERIGAGGMAEVYRGRLVGADGFEKTVCIKRILPHLAQAPDFAAMFRDEAAIAARLQHGNIVQIFDFGEERGSLFIAMEYVEGVSLARLLQTYSQRQELLPVPAVLKIGAEICKGLQSAHAAVHDGKAMELVHRDVTPHNILISKAGEVKVADFGVARADGRRTHTQTGIIKGKIQYMSPEQALGKKFDHRLDQFATGIVLWEALTGRRLFRGSSEFLILEAVTRADVKKPSELRPEIPPSVDAVILRALHKDPAKRYRDMSEFESALNDVLFKLAKNAAALDLKPIVARCVDKAPTEHAPQTVSVRAPVRASDVDEDPFDDAIHDKETRTSGVWVKAGDTPQMGASVHPGGGAPVTRERPLPSPTLGPELTRDMRGNTPVSRGPRPLHQRNADGSFATTNEMQAHSGTGPTFGAGSTVTAPVFQGDGTGGLTVQKLAIGGLLVAVLLAGVFVVVKSAGPHDDGKRADAGVVGGNDGCGPRQERIDGVCTPVPTVKVGAGGVGSTCGTHDDVKLTPAKSGLSWLAVVRPGADVPGDVRVVVTRREPIGLVLAAESAVTWRIEAPPSVRVERVILLSKKAQKVTGDGNFAVDDMSGAAAPDALDVANAAAIASAVSGRIEGVHVEGAVVCASGTEFAVLAPRTSSEAQPKEPPRVGNTAPPAFVEADTNALIAACGEKRPLRYATNAAGASELFVIGAGETGGVRVTSLRKTTHTIVLASENAVTWKIDRGAGSGLERILVTGNAGQRVSSGGVEVTDLTADRQTSGWRWPELDVKSDMLATFARAEQVSGAKVAGYLGCTDAKSFTIQDGSLGAERGTAIATPVDLTTVRARIASLVRPPEKCKRGCPDPTSLVGFRVFSEEEMGDNRPGPDEIAARLEAAVITVDDVRALLSVTERCADCVGP